MFNPVSLILSLAHDALPSSPREVTRGCRTAVPPGIVGRSLLAACLSLVACLPANAAKPPSLLGPVATLAGAVAGIPTSDGLVVAFRGIPYAAPPVGELRWKPPQPVTPWTGVRFARAFGPSCPQPDQVGRTSEDCLYLNIWAPAKPRGRNVPVMVWFHGGAFTSGRASLPIYDGEALARRGAVVVTFNYRLGPFGFFAHPLLTRESPHNASGNYGLLDQIAALRWVARNIRAFGGSPDHVTAFGQSAGAVSISCLLVSPEARGLFSRAILESGSALSLPRVGVTKYLNDAPAGEESMEQVGELISRRLGCDHEEDVLGALRARSTDEILIASRPAANFFGDGIRFGPVIDRWLIPDRPAALYATRQPKVAVMVGANADEGRSFAPMLQPQDVDSYRRFVRSTFRDRADEVLARFPVAHDGDVRSAFARLVGAAAFLAPARRTARAMAALGARTYLYWFTGDGRGRGAASHGAEEPFVFGTLGAARAGVSDGDWELAILMAGYWLRFAASGDPNGANAPPWPRYKPKSDRALDLGDQTQARGGMYHDACDFFDRIAGERGALPEPPAGKTSRH